MAGVRETFRGFRHPFVYGINYFGGVGDHPRTLTELAMSKYSSELRRIPRWWTKLQNPGVRKEWEAMGLKRVWNVCTPSAAMNVTLSKEQVRYILEELAGYDALRDEENGCQVSCFERIWELGWPEASFASPPSMNDQLDVLRAQILPRPSRDNVVTALIDPFLYCLVHSRTFISLESIKYFFMPGGSESYAVSLRYAFLPADVSISLGGIASFKSYINNLHPKTYSSLYTSLSSVLSKFLPLFEHTLTDLHRNNPLPQRIPEPSDYIFYDHQPEEPEVYDDDETWAEFLRESARRRLIGPLHLPEVPSNGYSGNFEKRVHTISLRGRDIQVIVSVDDMRLEPDGPSYSGSHWHVAGMWNERIAACGEYFTSMENITSTSLEFRMTVAHPRLPLIGDDSEMASIWGLRNGDPCHQYIGTRPITQGLGIVFPNLYQHRQTPFSLLDPMRPGHLTIVRFWLVDPEIEPVISTAVVPPQQETWMRAALEDTLGKILPAELLDHILRDVEGLMSASDAELYAKDLREARDKFRVLNDSYHFCIPFNYRGTTNQ